MDAVRWAIEVLTSQQVHPFFLAYLHIRARAIEAGTRSGVAPQWSELGDLLMVPGGPPGKPYYRPLMSRVHDRSRYWMNQNLAGSWAPSSLREGQAPLRVVETADQTFSLKADHARLARDHLLFNKPMSAMALATYLYRDYGFIKEGSQTPPSDVIATFVQDFRFYDADLFDPQSRRTSRSPGRIDPVAGRVGEEVRQVGGVPTDSDFALLFHVDIPERSDGWFEDFPASPVETLR